MVRKRATAAQTSARTLEMARTRRSQSGAQRRRTRDAVAELLRSLGHEPKGELRGTPERVAALWHDDLLRGEDMDPESLLRGGITTADPQPVSLVDVDVHLVCPHHLTVAFGKAHLAYLPGDRIAPFGRLVDLATACTARLVLQEEATTAMARALVDHLGATAAVAAVAATHPCHNLTRPRAHTSRALTWASAGHRGAARELRDLLKGALEARP